MSEASRHRNSVPQNTTSASQSMTTCEATLVTAEHNYLQQWWEAKNTRREKEERDSLKLDLDNIFGLALSGGGIRSASFAIGAMQALARAGVMENFHYLSTVSGGGFAGTSLTWLLSQKVPPAAAKYDVTPDRFPFEQPRHEAESPGAERRHGRGPLDFIRHHSSYLEPGAGLDKVSAFGIVARSLTLSLAVYFSLLTVVMWVLVASGTIQRSLFIIAGQTYSIPRGFIIAALILGLIFVVNLAYSFFSTFKLVAGRAYEWRRLSQIWLGRAWKLVIVFLALGLVVVLDSKLSSRSWSVGSLSSLGAISAALGTIGGFVSRFLSATQESGSSRRILPAVLVWSSSALLIFGFGLLAYIAAEHLIGRDGWGWALGLLLFGLFFGLFTNTNYTSLHRFYRDRLMEVFFATLGELSKRSKKCD